MVATSFDEIIAADLKNLKEKDANNLGKYFFDTPILIDWHGFLPTTSRNRFDPGQAPHTYLASPSTPPPSIRVLAVQKMH